MSIGTLTLIKGVIALVVGAVGGYFLNLIIINRRIASAGERAEKLISEAKQKAHDLLFESKEKTLKILDEAKKEEDVRNQQILRIETLLSKKESEIESRSKEIEQNRKV